MKDFFNFKISVKSSDVFLSIAAYRQLSKLLIILYILGITEAGRFFLVVLNHLLVLVVCYLLDGIGDTIRISLSDNPVEEVKIGNEILKSLKLKK